MFDKSHKCAIKQLLNANELIESDQLRAEHQETAKLHNLNCLDDRNRNIAINFVEINSNQIEWKFSHWKLQNEMKNAVLLNLPAIGFLNADCVEFSTISTALSFSLLWASAADKNIIWTKSNRNCMCLLLTRNFIIILT